MAIEVFDGNTGDPKTLSAQITKIEQRFALDRVVLVGDPGMITARKSSVYKADLVLAAAHSPTEYSCVVLPVGVARKR